VAGGEIGVADATAGNLTNILFSSDIASSVESAGINDSKLCISPLSPNIKLSGKSKFILNQ
jgi:hypothetical protein